MINDDISSVSSVDSSYKSLGKYADRRMAKLRKQCTKAIAENTYYTKPKVKDIVIYVVASLAVLYWAILKRADLKFFDSFSSMQLKSGMVDKIILYASFFIAFWLMYKAGILIYCMKLQGFSKRVDEIAKTVSDRISSLNSSALQKDLMTAINNNSDYDFPVKNDVGEMVNDLYKDLSATNKKAYSIRRIVRYVVTAISLLFLYSIGIMYWMHKSAESVRFAPFMLILLTAVIAHLFEFNLGEYLGKLAKTIGIATTAVSCLFIMLGMQKAIPVDFLEKCIPGVKGFILVPAVAFVGIALSVGFSHYALEIEKWQKGFIVPMEYGSKDNGNKMTLLIRGGISLALAVAAMIIAVSFEGAVDKGIIFGILWYMANPLLKPRGSYIYAFFGRGKCIGNTIILFALCTYLQLEASHVMDNRWIMFNMIAVISYFMAAFAAMFINDRI